MALGKPAALVAAIFGIFTPACRHGSTGTALLDDQAPQAAATPAAVLHDAVLADLASSHGSTRGSTWFDTMGSIGDNWVLQTPGAVGWGVGSGQIATASPCAQGQDCSATLGLKACRTDADCGDIPGTCLTMASAARSPTETPQMVCAASSDQVYDQMYKLVVTATTTVDIVSLSEPEGRFRTALLNALASLSLGPNKPEVRLLFGGGDEGTPNLFLSRKNRFNSIISDLRQLNPDFGLHVTYGWLSNGAASWNHAKIIAVDSRAAIVGGENLWTIYLSATPVHDFSIAISGAAARAAVAFADTLWQHRRTVSVTFPEGTAPALALAAPDTGTGDFKVLAIGRLGALGDNAADDALISLINHAQQNVHIVQQDLFNALTNPLFPSPTFVEEALAAAVLRGVDVSVVKSDKNGNGTYGMLTPEATYTKLVKFIASYAAKRGLSANVPAAVCSHFHVAPFRFGPDATWPDGKKFGIHTKLVVVDDTAFYAGSQNLYPASLQEFGYLVFDATKTQELLQAYWAPIWQWSSPAAVACPS